MEEDLERRAGLCATCVHSRRIVSARNQTFVLCALSETDPRFPKYPRLPVVGCSGYVPVRGEAPRKTTS
jgi:hypothetical protein